MKLFTLYILLVFFSCLSYAQENDSILWQEFTKTYAYKDTIVLNKNLIKPESIKILDWQGTPLSNIKYEFIQEKNAIVFSSDTQDSVQISFMRHQVLNALAVRINPDIKILPEAPISELKAYIQSNKKTIKPFEGIQSAGSIVRGITLGNNQNGSVQSSLDLKLEGKLNDKIGIRAAIADDNSPIENEGFTQNLNQFDRIFVELYSDQFRLRAGHIELEEVNNPLILFNRKVTGVQAETNIKIKEGNLNLMATGSTSRGTFAQYQFNGKEGNQGPYPLKADTNDAYVLILADSERIYLNGILLERGETLDYTINYTTGEVLFTNKRMIRSTDIVLTEFLYTNQNYTKYLVHSALNYTKKKWNIGGSFYTENDIKNSPINQNFTNEELQLLANSEDNNVPIYVSSAVETAYDESKILYRKITNNGTEFFEYSTDSATLLYSVYFTKVEDNGGDYIYSESAVNGSIFTYVAPIDGVSQGNYTPFKLLKPPQKHQIYAFNAGYETSNTGRASIDAAISNKDFNLYSGSNQTSNLGGSVLLNFKETFKIRSRILKPTISYNFISENFKPLERIRSAQFSREFNIDRETGIGNQHFATLLLPLQWNEQTHMFYATEYLSNPKNYSGLKNSAGLTHSSIAWENVLGVSYLTTSQREKTTQFLEFKADVARKWKDLSLGLGAIGETNRWKRDNLFDEDKSFSWQEFYHYAQLQKADKSLIDLRLYYRKDDSIQYNKFTNSLQSTGLRLTSDLIKNANRNLFITADYRYVKNNRTSLTNQFLATEVRGMQSLKKGGLVINAVYSLSGGNDFERAFTYVKVTEGLGIYKWTDYNLDGIEQIDEFEVAEFVDQAEYIRLFTNNTQNVLTNKNALSLSAQFSPAFFFLTESNAFKRITAFVSINTQGNFLKNNKIAEWNPFSSKQNSKSRNQAIIARLQYLNNGEARFSSVYEFSKQENFRLIYTGLEKLINIQNEWQKQYKISPSLIGSLMNAYRQQKSSSEMFLSRRYHVKEFETKTAINYKFKSNLSGNLSFSFKKQHNTLGEEKLNSISLSQNLQWNKTDSNSVLASLSFIKNNFYGNAFSLVGNTMLEGLKPNANWVWSLNIQQRLNDFLYLDINYSGRKTESLKAIHNANIQIRANF